MNGEREGTGAPRRTRLLIVSTEMHVGGVTTALLALLNTIDYSRFDVDLLLYEHTGPWQKEIPGAVRLLPPARETGLRSLARKLASPRYIAGRLNALALKKLRGRPLEGLQVRARLGSRYARRWPDSYDLAISFIEFWPLYYTARYVNARRKLAWIHIDYQNCAMSVKRDAVAFPAYDRIVMVSEKCVHNFAQLCPAYADRAVYLPNIVSEASVRARAQGAPARALDKARIRLVTVARLQNAHKGLDRGVSAFDALRRAGELDGVIWYIIGGGSDEAALRAQIAALGREREIILLGWASNPLPYVRMCDAFVLPSHYEGKPIAVTEAMILGLPALVTNYASAAEQVEDGVDGLIVENSQEGIRQGLSRLCDTPGLLESLRGRARSRHYGNEAEIARYYTLLKEIGVPVGNGDAGNPDGKAGAHG